MILYVMQDGADFYAYRDEGMTDLVLTRSAPFPVTESLTLAMKARDWFIQLCSNRTRIHWITT